MNVTLNFYHHEYKDKGPRTFFFKYSGDQGLGYIQSLCIKQLIRS